jgi:hypothetical protein
VRDEQGFHGEDSPQEAADGANHPRLPADLCEDLMRLARQGQAVALRQRLRRAHDELPGYSATLKLLAACADRFDFHALMTHLRNDQDAVDDLSHN